MTRPAPGRVRCAALLLLVASGCLEAEAPAGHRTIRVFAAASLTESFEALARAFEEAHPGHEIELHFAGTPRLVLQLREGAAADVFAAADVPSMQRAIELGSLEGSPVVFARARLALAVPPGNPARIEGLADLARPGALVALCGPDVPAGRYARRVLALEGIEARSVSDEPSVKAIVAKLELGELDAGIVYATDVLAAGERLEEVPLPETAVRAAYPIATSNTGANPEGGRRFVEFVGSTDGQAILRAFGFETP